MSVVILLYIKIGHFDEERIFLYLKNVLYIFEKIETRDYIKIRIVKKKEFV